MVVVLGSIEYVFSAVAFSVDFFSFLSSPHETIVNVEIRNKLKKSNFLIIV